MKILLLGKSGQVGHELVKHLDSLCEVVACNRREANFEQDDQLRLLLRSTKPDIIVNAAAYTAVDQAETEEDLANQINATAVGVLADHANETGALLVHYSTDYVFDGEKDGSYNEEDVANPQSVYGATKLAGDRLIEVSGCKHIIIRPSWVYSNRGNNFVTTILNLASTKQELRVIDDQIGVPTSAQLIAHVTADILNQYIENQSQFQSKFGTYHLTPSGETNWHNYAKVIVKFASLHGGELQLKPEAIIPIPTSEYPQPATRPKNSMLDTTKVRTTFGVTLPNWEDELHGIIPSLLTRQSQLEINQ